MLVMALLMLLLNTATVTLFDADAARAADLTAAFVFPPDPGSAADGSAADDVIASKIRQFPFCFNDSSRL